MGKPLRCRMEVIREAPKASTFVPLAEHQSATPASFYTGPPVLHYHSDRSKVIVLERDASGAALLEPLLQHASSAPGANTNGGAETNGHGETSDSEQKVLEDVDVWVTSDKLFLFSNVASTGLSIPYPSISLHAIQTPAQALFNALSNCSNLHPDPVEDEEEDGAQGSRLIQSGLAIPLGGEGSGLPPPMPGSGGWITAENMHEFVDEDGNWIEDAGEEAAGEAPLGPGAGTVRSRDDGEDGGGGDNTAADGEDAKWQRTG